MKQIDSRLEHILFKNESKGPAFCDKRKFKPLNIASIMIFKCFCYQKFYHKKAGPLEPFMLQSRYKNIRYEDLKTDI